MTHIRSRAHAPASVRSSLAPVRRWSPALGCLVAALPGLAAAQSAAPSGTDATLPAVRATAASESDIQVQRSASPKQTQDLVDTPQTITVVNQALLRQQGATTLTDALRNTPGITLQLGENGNTSAGDTFYLRGFAAQSNVYVDGLRDLGTATRDTYNLEQVEIVKGPAGADVGRGAVGGYVNLITRTPQADDFGSVDFTLGTAARKRLSADVNRRLGDSVAVRLDAFVDDADVPGRDEVHNRSVGLAPSISFGLGTPTRFIVQTQHLRQRNTPDGGVSTIGLDGYYHPAFDTGGAAAGVTPSRVDPSNYYGGDGDHERIDSDLLTVRVEHEFSPTLSLYNTSRFGHGRIDRVLTGVGDAEITSTDPSGWTVQRRRQVLDQTNEILANQTVVRAELDTAGVHHSLAGGLEFMQETQDVTTYAVPGAVRNLIPSSNLYQPASGADMGPAPEPNGAYAHGRITTAAAFLFDTLKFNEQWQLLAGLRYERYRATTDRADVVTTTTPPITSELVSSQLRRGGGLTSWKLGAVYKPRPDGTVYLGYANSASPPGSNGLTLASTDVNPGSADRSDTAVQKSQNVEIGTKWSLLDQRLTLSGAWYRTENRNELVQLDDLSYAPSGKRRVQGIELGAVGQITPDWQVNLGLTTMDSEMVAGAATGTNAAGAPSRWTPKFAATAWTSYRFLGRYTVGGGARYLGKQLRATDPNADAAVTTMPEIPSYWVADAMAAMDVTDRLSLRLNVYNVFDKSYIGTLNNAGNRYVPSAPRTATLTASLLF